MKSVKDSPSDPPDDWIVENYEKIHRAAWLMTGDAWEAEDLAQETFAIALDRWGRFEGRSSVSTWLFGILIRVRNRRSRSIARMRRRLQRYGQLHVPPTSENPETLLAQSQWRESVWAEVARLPKPQRDAVTLRFANELGYEQIAEIVGCAVGTAKTRVHHGLKRLKQSDCPTLPQPTNDLNAPLRLAHAADTTSRSR